MPMDELRARSHGPDGKRFLIEMQQAVRLSGRLPGAHAGGRAAGRDLAARRKKLGDGGHPALVVSYYSLSLIGIALGRQNWISAFLAVWSANLLFAAGGIFLLWQMASGGRILGAITALSARSPGPKTALALRPAGGLFASLVADFKGARPAPGSRGVFPRILDQYVVLEFLKTFSMVLSAFVVLMLVFTVFDLLGDILRNHPPLSPRSATI